jgi:hypothetical protein
MTPNNALLVWHFFLKRARQLRFNSKALPVPNSDAMFVVA